MKFKIITACTVACCMAGQTAQASFHVMQIEQIIGGVNGDPTVQAIQLRMRSAGQNNVNFGRIRAFDAAGSNPVIIATFASPVANSATGSRVLITSPNFASHASPALVTDKVMNNVIPASYLNAGSLTFEDSSGSTIYWRVSWGGAGYTGITTGSTTNDTDGNFGKLTATLQSSSLQAVKFLGAATAPSVTNQSDYAVTAGDAMFNNNAGTSFTVTAGCPTITVSPATLPNAEAGEPYSQNLSASGGAAPYDFAVTSGSLPSGLTLTSGGVLSGTPDGVGLSNFTVTATASNSCTGQKVYSLGVACPIVTISPSTLPSGTINVPYSQSLTGDGGAGPYEFAVTTGSLPDGLSLSNEGEITGTPTTPGLADFIITATNSDDCPGDQTYSISIAGSSATGDLDGSGTTDGLDISHFVDCVISGSTSGGSCGPGDFNNTGGVDANDVGPFIAALGRLNAQNPPRKWWSKAQTMPPLGAEPDTDQLLSRCEPIGPPLAWWVLIGSRSRFFCPAIAIIALLISRTAAQAHDCALVVGRDDANPPRLYVNGPSNYLSGDEAIELLPGDGQFEGMWIIDAPGISTLLKDGVVRRRLRLRAGHRLALRLVSADPGFCMIEPSTWTPVLCKPGDTYPFVQPEPGSFNIQMVSKLSSPKPCRATFQFVDLAGLHADSAPFTLCFRVNPVVAIGRSFAPAITAVGNPGLQFAAYWLTPLIMNISAGGSAASGNVRAADGHMHGAAPVWVEPLCFKQGVNLFRGHLHELDAELLTERFSAAALRAPVLQRLAVTLPSLMEKPGSSVPATSRQALLDSYSKVAAICDDLSASARLSDPIAVREQHDELAKFLAACDVFIPPEFICPMRCEGEKTYAAQRDCPICSMALADSRAHLDHKPKHGGTFFMASDYKHHLEGVLFSDALPKGEREFRVFIYDEFTQPLASNVVTARAVLSNPSSDDVHKVELRPDAKREFLSAPVPLSLNPVSIKLYVDFKNARGEQLFNFRF